MKKIFHPIICCALSADLAAFLFGFVSKVGTDAVLGCLSNTPKVIVFDIKSMPEFVNIQIYFPYIAGDYLTKVATNPGAGDILMGFLGSVIISFAFSMFKQRKVCFNF